MIAIERFESRPQQECECRIRGHVLALQDECQDHVGSEEMNLELNSNKPCSVNRVYVQESVQNETRLQDSLTSETLEEMTAVRQKPHEQELAMQKVHF